MLLACMVNYVHITVDEEVHLTLSMVIHLPVKLCKLVELIPISNV